MASSSPHSNNNIPLDVQLEWYKIRDTFFGHNMVSPSIPLALELASKCSHPDARWLTEVCAGKDVKTRDDAREVFLALDQSDARALCFAAFSGKRHDVARLEQACTYPFAAAWMSEQTKGKASFVFAQLAADMGERDGFYWLGRSYRDGEGCEKDLDKAKEYFLLAVKHKSVYAMSEMALLFTDVRRWMWFAKAIDGGFVPQDFVAKFPAQVQIFRGDPDRQNAPIIFQIGCSFARNPFLIDQISRMSRNQSWIYSVRFGLPMLPLFGFESESLDYRLNSTKRRSRRVARQCKHGRWSGFILES